MFKVTFLIKTDSDPSTVLDAAIAALPELIGNIEAAEGEPASGDESDVCVEEVA